MMREAREGMDPINHSLITNTFSTGRSRHGAFCGTGEDGGNWEGEREVEVHRMRVRESEVEDFIIRPTGLRKRGQFS